MATNDIRSSQSSGFVSGGMTYKKISYQLKALGIPEEVYKEKVWEAIRNKSKTIDFSYTVNNEDGRSEHQISLRKFSKGPDYSIGQIVSKSEGFSVRFPVGGQFAHMEAVNRLLRRRDGQPVSILIKEFQNSEERSKPMKERVGQPRWITVKDEKFVGRDGAEYNSLGFSALTVPLERFGHKIMPEEMKSLEAGKPVMMTDCQLYKIGTKEPTGLVVPQQVWVNALSEKDWKPGSTAEYPSIFGYKSDVDINRLYEKYEESLAGQGITGQAASPAQPVVPQQTTNSPRPVVQQQQAADHSWQAVPGEYLGGYALTNEIRQTLSKGQPVHIKDFPEWNMKEKKLTGKLVDIKLEWALRDGNYRLKSSRLTPDQSQAIWPYNVVGRGQIEGRAKDEVQGPKIGTEQQGGGQPVKGRRGRKPGSKNRPKGENEAKNNQGNEQVREKRKYTRKAVVIQFSGTVNNAPDNGQAKSQRMN